MLSLFGTVRTAAAIFVGTNVEDLVVLTTLFLTSHATGRPRAWQIWVGQYTGIAILVVLGAAGALGFLAVPAYWAGLVGIAPLSIGVYKLIRAIRARGGRAVVRPVMATGVMAVAGLAISNGGDNLSIYIPVFRTIGPWRTMIMVAVFSVGVAVWCLAASLLGSHKKIVEAIERYGHWIVPGVYILIGALIVTSSGVIDRLG